MALYALGDLHLSLSTNKPMDIFGDKWQNYVEKIRRGFAPLTEDDVTVLCGDLSWGMSLQQSLADFQFCPSTSFPAKRYSSRATTTTGGRRPPRCSGSSTRTD